MQPLAPLTDRPSYSSIGLREPSGGDCPRAAGNSTQGELS